MIETGRKKLALVTGVSSDLGLEFARLCAHNRFDLIIAADELSVFDAAQDLAGSGVTVSPVRCDLSTFEGVDALCNAIAVHARPLDLLIANAGRHSELQFCDQDINQPLIDGTISLIYQLGRAMRERGHGRILVTGAIAGLTPRGCQALYGGTKALLASFCVALRNDLKNSGVSVTCLVPGAPPEATVFADPKDIALTGYDAMMRGKSSVIYGLGINLRAIQIPESTALLS